MKKRQIRTIFLFQVKPGQNAAETARDMNESSRAGTAIEHIAQWCFKNFWSDDESLEDEERSGRPSNDHNDQLRALVNTNACTIVRELSIGLCVTLMTIFGQLKVIEKSKHFDKGVSYKLRDHKNPSFEVSSALILGNNNDPFLDWFVMCDEK